ncbi:MAG: bifunctional 5,10-methylenetetrahydrofolate dehydrogenase/5,10-methenyltetrahydrofolate cyclohydrolase [Corallococcus sp.]|nr:bifunctional 5,10-methylenetetrahydrofolate dehydrogenase/5,10-methenyltetrahydrofolate cyclohydrolase [Corallococcus sp.]MCM1359706.1 bifunctional 5,10-methylenetetrahydrofolate dehydrogenase/5,10-methenyltetrahydrofolate cyclohydrolase [Corallococcus sp.]MCM1395415.1 bifunctional 5,10-methylenetetrahydrofolate dehydrogenase/5,10-methenyltetrahydrofolate cyclohydrolase [Corallococcus sp.]
MAKLLLGKPVADAVYAGFNADDKSKLTLATVGLDSPEWRQYVRSLAVKGEQIGVKVENLTADASAEPIEFCGFVKFVCGMADVNGVLLQQPLPKLYADAKSALDAAKDVDCLSPLAVAKLYSGEDCIAPATPTAVINLLDYYGVELEGKNVVIIGRSNAVGKPLALLLLKRNATVTVCHTKTRGLADICRRADIIVSACGCPNLVTRDFVTERSVVVDVGLSFVEGKSCGDVAQDVREVAAAVSPVPGGVGPVTVAALFQNLQKVGN